MFDSHTLATCCHHKLPDFTLLLVAYPNSIVSFYIEAEKGMHAEDMIQEDRDWEDKLGEDKLGEDMVQRPNTSRVKVYASKEEEAYRSKNHSMDLFYNWNYRLKTAFSVSIKVDLNKYLHSNWNLFLLASCDHRQVMTRVYSN